MVSLNLGKKKVNALVECHPAAMGNSKDVQRGAKSSSLVLASVVVIVAILVFGIGSRTTTKLPHTPADNATQQTLLQESEGPPLHEETFTPVSGFGVVGTVKRRSWNDYAAPAERRKMDIQDLVADGRTPVVLSDSPGISWKSVGTWNPSYISKWMPTLPKAKVSDLHGDFLYFLPETSAIKGVTLEHHSSWKENVRVKAKKFFKVCEDASKPPYAYYFHVLQKEASLEGWERIQKDIEPRDFMIVGEITDEKQLGVFAKMADRSVSNVWIGCAGVVTHLHNDYAHNFYFQVDGYKRFLIVPPQNHTHVAQFPVSHPAQRQSQRNFSLPLSAQTHTLGTHVQPLEVLSVVLGPGDLFYLPPYWYHHVMTVETSISINVWSPSRERSLYEALADVEAPKALKSGDQLQSLTARTLYILTTLTEVLGKARARHLIASELLQARFAPLYTALSCDDTVFDPQRKCWPVVEVADAVREDVERSARACVTVVKKFMGVKKLNVSKLRTSARGALEIILIDWVEYLLKDADNICHVARCLRQDKYWRSV